MEIIFMNTENIKTSEAAHSLKLGLTGKLN